MQGAFAWRACEDLKFQASAEAERLLPSSQSTPGRVTGGGSSRLEASAMKSQDVSR